MTNGEKIKEIFPNAEISYGLRGVVAVTFIHKTIFDLDWWDAEYKEPKTGHWIADVDKWGDVVTTVNGYRCDKCNTFNADKDNYCPNCGAKMAESEE